MHRLAILTLACALPAAAAPPSFVVILTDDQSWTGTSFLADPDEPHSTSDYYQTPNMKRLAESGMRFTAGYSPAPFCCPTRRSLLIGQSPLRHVYQRDQDAWPARFREQLSIPRMLKRADPSYRTAHFGKWDMRFDLVTPEEMGYDVSDGYTTNRTGGLDSQDKATPKISDDPKLAFSITDRACQFIEQQSMAGHPFYVQVSHYAVHLGMYSRKSTVEKYRLLAGGKKHHIPPFAAMTEDLDTAIGNLLDKLDSLGLRDTTYVFFLSDNGGRNDIPARPPRELPRNYPLRDGKGSMYEGGIRVPFVVAGPNVLPGSVSRVPATGLDILPTLADLAGLDEKLPDSLDGGSLRQVLHHEGQAVVRRNIPFLIFHQAVERKPQTAIRVDNFKLVKTADRLELFDLSRDLGEQNDLSSSMPQKCDELHAMMTKFIARVNAETRRTEN